MKKLSVIMILVLFTLALFSCSTAQKPQSDLNVNTETESDSAPFVLTFQSFHAMNTDLFICEVLTEKTLDKNIKFDNLRYHQGTPVLYTVKIKSTLWGETVPNESEIEVVTYVQDKSEGMKYWANPLEIGGTYMIAGLIQPYNDKAVILNSNCLSLKIDKDAIFIEANRTEDLMSDVKTLSELMSLDGMKTLLESKVDRTIFSLDDVDSKEVQEMLKVK